MSSPGPFTGSPVSSLAKDVPLKLVGAPGSPYSRKLRALLRYRRIPFHWLIRGGREDHGIPEVPVGLIPVLVFPGKAGSPGEAGFDTTPLIRRLEGLYAERSVVPPDPAMAFIDALIEDYADEWLTKAMFHYRWSYAPDIDKAAAVLPLWRRVDVPNEQLAPFSKGIAERQIARLWVVGSNEVTGPVIEASYQRFLALFDAHLRRYPFVMGHRPGSSDFGLFGQLTQLLQFDPTPSAVGLEVSPRAFAWVDIVEDLSGADTSDDQWISRDTVPDSLRALLAELGRVYVPFLLANAAALESGAERVECTIDGREWVQKPFPYQGKCLGWLRDAHAKLDARDRDAATAILEGTGCQELFRSG
jgi:glutathione S-transferase